MCWPTIRKHIKLLLVVLNCCLDQYVYSNTNMVNLFYQSYLFRIVREISLPNFFPCPSSNDSVIRHLKQGYNFFLSFVSYISTVTKLNRADKQIEGESTKRYWKRI